MILSERELELGQDHGGIMVLPDSLEAGTPLADVLPVGDDILEIETLYNRPDLTSIYGIAREVAALTGGELKPMPGTDPARAGEEPVDIRIEDLEHCSRYVGRLFREVQIGQSPAWLKARLLGAGMRPISNVVDVTNYVMLALGNPLHAFDFDKLDGGRIIVRWAAQGEELERRAVRPVQVLEHDDERWLRREGGQRREQRFEDEALPRFEVLGRLLARGGELGQQPGERGRRGK
jgi:phenylalanyl-tRNA synthetase beta chain